MDAIIAHGDTVPLLTDKRIVRRLDGLDTGTLRYTTTNPNAFAEGQALLDAPGLIVQDCECEQDGDDYDFTLSVLGIDGGKASRRLKGFPDPHYSLTDWDRVEDAWLTSNPNQIVEGQLGSFGGTTVCISANPKPVYIGWYEVRGSYIGIIRQKPRQRTISVNGQTISGESITVNLPGGWTTPQKGQAQLPKLVVRDRYLGFTPPPTNLIPGPAQPPNAPQVKFFTVSGTDVTRYWPGGWHLASLGSEQIADKGIYAVDWIYEYQYPITP